MKRSDRNRALTAIALLVYIYPSAVLCRSFAKTENERKFQSEDWQEAGVRRRRRMGPFLQLQGEINVIAIYDMVQRVYVLLHAQCSPSPGPYNYNRRPHDDNVANIFHSECDVFAVHLE